MTKADIIRLANRKCEAHHHSYLEHYNCYLKENADQIERIGFLDIEATNLDADFGFILSYCIKVAQEDEIYMDVLKPKDLKVAKAGDEDRRIVVQLLEDLNNFDKIVTYYGKRYDIPYIRARAVSMGIPFPNFGTLKHIDLYDTIKHKFKLSSRRLENACRVLLGETDKTRVDGKYWRAASRGDKASLDYIIDHNQKDVVDLEKLYDKTINFQRKNDTSI